MRPPARTSSSSTSDFSSKRDSSSPTGGVPDHAVVGADLDHVAHVQAIDRRLEYQRAGVFHRVVEDRGHLAADADTAERLLGTPGMSSPKNHSTELVADLRLEPVPTTSPTKAIGCPSSSVPRSCGSARLRHARRAPGHRGAS
jgi:hypothetical protein